jgi:hypothetical protein
MVAKGGIEPPTRGRRRPTPEGQWIEMTFPKLPFNSEADTFTKYQSSGKIKHNG